MKLLLLLLATMLLSSCSILSTQKQDKAHLNTAQSIQQAELLSKQKQYSKAEDLLVKARKFYPNEIKLKQLLEQVKIERQEHKQLLEDQLLAARLTLIQQQRSLLAQLAKSEADDLIIHSHLLQLKKTWQESQPLLSTCGERQLKKAPNTAEKCLRLALAIKEQPHDRKQLTQIEHSKANAAKKKQQKLKQTRVEQLLKQAHLKQKHNDRYSALALLEQTLKLAPKSTHAINLKKEIQKQLEDHTQSLLSAGETLYQRGQIKGAITVWNTLLLLNPQHKKAHQKIKRAQRVLDNLQQLRHQQNSPVHRTE